MDTRSTQAAGLSGVPTAVGKTRSSGRWKRDRALSSACAQEAVDLLVSEDDALRLSTQATATFFPRALVVRERGEDLALRPATWAMEPAAIPLQRDPRRRTSTSGRGGRHVPPPELDLGLPALRVLRLAAGLCENHQR